MPLSFCCCFRAAFDALSPPPPPSLPPPLPPPPPPLPPVQDYCKQQLKKKVSVSAQQEFMSASKLTDSDVMHLRHATYDPDLQFERMRKSNG